MSSNSSASSYASAASAVMVATEATYATYIKEIMANMPDDLDSKKDIDNFYKAAIKDIKGKIKDANKAAKTATKAAKAAKKKSKKASDEDDVEKVKKPPSAYQIFLKENRASVKEENPELTGKECTELLRTMWSKHKEDKA
jgi:uncharacterized membrane protein